MSEEHAFLQAILASPADDSVRLIYADWLDDHGLPDRAEFIRVQCQLSRLEADDPGRIALELRQSQLLHANQKRWRQELPGAAQHGLASFQRGFAAELRCSARHFLEGAAELRRVAPLQEVYLFEAGNHAEALAASPLLAGLESLTLRGNIGPELARGLASSRHLTSLRKLDLGDNRIGDEGAEAVARSPHLANLAVLGMGRNRLTERGQALLRERFGTRVRF